jgi:hypothetical protein
MNISIPCSKIFIEKYRWKFSTKYYDEQYSIWSETL